MSLALPMVQMCDPDLYERNYAEYTTIEAMELPGNMSATPQKRPMSEASSEPATKASDLINGDRLGSPTPSTASSLTSLSGTPALAVAEGSTHPAQPPTKKRKLTPAEREVREREKAEKRANREVEKARREEEKQKRDEERRQKNEVLEEKRREKELKKQEKEEVKRQEEEEKAKKERAQSRINSFFARPKPSPQAEKPINAVDSSDNTNGNAIGASKNASAQCTPSKPSRFKTDYDRTFLPFAAPSHATVASPNFFTWDEDCTQKALENADTWFRSSEIEKKPSSTLSKCLDVSPYEAPERGWVDASVAELMSSIDGTETNTIDLTNENTSAPLHARTRLKEHPVKYLHFKEDVRPPYLGTNSRFKTKQEALRLARRPTSQIRKDLEYDYDSEAEWEEPEEGEELGSEGEDEDESLADAEELEEFLDDEGADDPLRSKKRFMSGDMQPVSTGLCWEIETSKLQTQTHRSAINPLDYRMEILSDTFSFPIDPFSNAYWPTEVKVIDNQTTTSTSSDRLPLLPRSNIHVNGTAIAPVNESLKPQKAAKQPKQLRLLSGQDLEEFKQIVQDSELTKLGLLAVAKKKLPKVPNAVLSDTLSTIAARVGMKEADKRWTMLQSNQQ